MARAQALNLDVNLKKFDQGLAKAGGNLEKTFDTSIKNIDKKVSGIGKGANLKGNFNAEGQGMGIGSALAIGVGAGLAQAGVTGGIASFFTKVAGVANDTIDTISNKTSKGVGVIQSKLDKELKSAKKMLKAIAFAENGKVDAFWWDSKDGLQREERKLTKFEKVLKRVFKEETLERWSKSFSVMGKQAHRNLSGLRRSTSLFFRGMKTQASAALVTLGKAASTVWKAIKFGGVVIAGATVVIGALFATGAAAWKWSRAMVDSFTPIRKAMASIQKTIDRISESGAKASRTFRKMMAESGSLGTLTGVGQEQFLAAQSFALRAGIATPETATATVALASNIMADPANKITDLNDAVLKIQEVLKLEEGAIKKLGINFKKSGDDAESIRKDTERIAEELNKIYGGSPQFVDANLQFTAAWDSVKQIVGKTLTPFVEKTLGQASRMLIGFVESGKAEDMAESIAYYFEVAKNFLVEGFNLGTLFLEGMSNTFYGLKDFLKEIFIFAGLSLGKILVDAGNLGKRVVADVLAKLGEGLSKVPGFGDAGQGLINMSDNLKASANKNVFDDKLVASSDKLVEAFDRMKMGTQQLGSMFSGQGASDSTNFFNDMYKQGDNALAAAMGAFQGQVTAGPSLLDDIQRRADEERKKALEELAAKWKDISANDNENLQLNVGIKSLSPNRFRRVRARR